MNIMQLSAQTKPTFKTRTANDILRFAMKRFFLKEVIYFPQMIYIWFI